MNKKEFKSNGNRPPFQQYKLHNVLKLTPSV